MILGLDVSHFQGLPNFSAVKASSRDFVILKATEGTGYVDPTFTANRRAAHTAGLIVGAYHFAKAGNPANEATYFLGVVGSLQPGEFLVLDWETAYSGDHVAWCRAWLDAVRAHTGIAPLIYMNRSTMNGHNWSPIAADYGLWLAVYDGSTAQPAVTSWSAAAMKQYSDKGSVLGVAGTCDVDVFYGSTVQLLAYGSGGSNVATAIDMNAFLNSPAYYPGGQAGPTISEVLMRLDQFVQPVARGDAPGGLVPLRQEIADAKTAALAAQAGLSGLTPEALAAAIVAKVGELPQVDADKVAALVISQLGQRINTPPAA